MGVQIPAKADISLDLNMDKVEPEYHALIRSLGSNPIRGDATHLPIRNGSINRLYWNAILEHIPRELTIKTIHEGSRVLKPGGEARVVLPIITSHMRHCLRILFTEFPFSLWLVVIHLWHAHLYWHIPGVPHLTDVKPQHLRAVFKEVKVEERRFRHSWFHRPWGNITRRLVNNRYIPDIQGQYYVRCIK